jgi:hypothetical protein
MVTTTPSKAYAERHSILSIWSPTQKWLTKMLAIYDFGQPFQIVNIF